MTITAKSTMTEVVTVREAKAAADLAQKKAVWLAAATRDVKTSLANNADYRMRMDDTTMPWDTLKTNLEAEAMPTGYVLSVTEVADETDTSITWFVVSIAAITTEG